MGHGPDEGRRGERRSAGDALPFRIRGTHVHAIATAKAEEKARRENAKKFYYDSAEGREWCDRVSQPLRAAAKFKG